MCLQESPIHFIIKELLSFIMSRIFSTYAEAMDGYIVDRCHHCQEYIHSHITDCFGCKDCDMEVDRDAIDDKDDEEWKPEDAAVGKDSGTKVEAEETSCQVVYTMPDGSLHEYEVGDRRRLFCPKCTVYCEVCGISCCLHHAKNSYHSVLDRPVTFCTDCEVEADHGTAMKLLKKDLAVIKKRKRVMEGKKKELEKKICSVEVDLRKVNEKEVVVLRKVDAMKEILDENAGVKKESS